MSVLFITDWGREERKGWKVGERGKNEWMDVVINDGTDR